MAGWWTRKWNAATFEKAGAEQIEKWSKEMTIDWDAPLETDEDEPRPALVVNSQSSHDEYRASVIIGRSQFEYVVTSDGVTNRYGGPPLRNVRPRAANQEAWDRMEILTRNMAAIGDNEPAQITFSDLMTISKEAQAIVKLLPPERVRVDLDAVAVREILEEWVKETGSSARDLALAALKRGKSMGRGQ